MMNRITESAFGCFKYTLANYEPVPGDFGRYEAFFAYSMAVKRLGEYEDGGLTPEECKRYADLPKEA